MKNCVEAIDAYVTHVKEESNPKSESRSPHSDDESIWTGLTDEVNISNVSSDRSTLKD
eukprot:CAMPEP_0201679098 /NCGR_PEP_ID=MMETSP0494-20130426/47705_1 /ASSEMBLY_ACC=CAM_ASM_000839 /TAXON_ID=420259 /ORGANISM="Thalassiosira gravida, Strain GMp14c1" /LENGTH=57 /DNA_ID=CAMNT_0048162473 /DNA_START=122 /DNA_END=295 /DNA_ORIENTATION=+